MQDITTKQRVHMMDELRGLCICAMILYHGAYDLSYLFSISTNLLYSTPVQYLQSLFGGMFILIAGASSRFSRNNIKRGLQCLLCGMGLTLVTGLIVPDQMIRFGILHMLGVAMLLFGCIQPWLDRIGVKLRLFLTISLFVLTFDVPRGFVGIPWVLQIPLPVSWYDAAISRILFPFGIYSAQFASADYYPLLPWFFLFVVGTCIGVPLKENRFPSFFYQRHSRFLSLVGRHSLVIYLVHQPILYGAVWGAHWLLSRTS